jgi:hypothetical protein
VCYFGAVAINDDVGATVHGVAAQVESRVCHRRS